MKYLVFMISSIAVLISGFMIYVSYDQINERSEYVEACLYISETRDQKQSCYTVYPEDHKSSKVTDTMFWGASFFISSLVAYVALAVIKGSEDAGDKQMESLETK